MQEMEFCIENIEDKDICFYTGFPNREVYKAVLTYLNPGPNGENLVYTRNDSRPDIESTPLRNIGTQCAQSQCRFFFFFSQYGEICPDNLWDLHLR